MLPISCQNKDGAIGVINSTLGYLGDLKNMDNPNLTKMFNELYLQERQLN